MREVEVVENRNEPEKILDVIRAKMVEKSYGANTILVCLIVTPGIYDLKLLSVKLAEIKSSLKHVFVIFTGATLPLGTFTPEQFHSTYTLVQLLPVFEQSTLDSRPHLEDFMQRYNKGQESRLIEGSGVYFGTSNKKCLPH